VFAANANSVGLAGSTIQPFNLTIKREKSGFFLAAF
jgi:hypothetical protein